jgi:hypothetical protein
MPESISLLMVEFLTWISSCHRTYDEAAEAWRSTCPRHTVWEDAFIDGFIQVTAGDAPDRCEVTLTHRGRAILRTSRNNPSGEASSCAIPNGSEDGR